MKINLNKEDKDKLDKLIKTKEFNITTADLLNDLCYIRDNDLEKEYKSNKWLLYGNNSLTSWAIYLLGIDVTLKSNTNFINRFLSSTFVEEDVNKYEENSFKSCFKPSSIKNNSYSFKYEKYPAYSFFPLEDITVIDDDYYREVTKIGLFKKEYEFLTLYHGNDIWMCITPNEMNTMENAINNASGTVVTLGLGLGYFAYMTALKQNVKKVIIVEKDQNIINLFSTHLLPHFKTKNKIEIVNSDALDTIDLINSCDYCFCDLWHDANDGLPIYLKLKPKITIKADYWIEESIIALYRRCLLTVIEESLHNKHDNDYKYAYNNIDKIINNIYFQTKNVEFFTYKSIHEFCSKNNILKLITK